MEQTKRLAELLFIADPIMSIIPIAGKLLTTPLQKNSILPKRKRLDNYFQGFITLEDGQQLTIKKSTIKTRYCKSY